nr:DUF6644 family protein [Pseudaminobacter soli]
MAALEHTGLVRLLKGSFYVYPIVNALHVAAIGALFTSVLLMDLRLLGALKLVAGEPFLALMRRVALLAFLGAVITGLALFSVRATEYAAMPIFLAKMGLIVLAGLNFLLFLWLARKRPADKAPSPAQQASALVSMLLWTSVLLAGRFIGFVA